ncbi:aldehyde dehydrogenase family protein [Ornithinimicrobium sp. F0845]|uniref:aldehyde dehydrogenase family protein n=1 Tax=Ornithinimicrobium sp. F0845 TaxID=2926412 RepID=UPI001FF518D9|nr:aldehyde dehydrogenase family protein [Ornithinimicrobium sp. F0845]MCK0112313.1 aldehyde dehydrogenase family protein [Ornithinimicrobium sp. F0845]
MDLISSFIGGQDVASAGTYDNIDPATGQSLGPVSRGGAEEVDRAVAAGAAAQRDWIRSTPEQRSDLLTAWAGLVDRDAERLARLESEDTGKPIGQARTDAAVAARYLRFYAHAIDSYYGLTIPKGPDLHVYTVREPFGVVGSVIAWNYPMQLFSRSVAAAVATGNATVVKPADETPRTAIALARLAVEAGIPAGIVNVVTGTGAEAGAALTAHPGIGHLSFVGSTEVGSVIAHAAADRVVPTVLELGGKSAQVVFADADLTVAAEAIARGALQNAGQTCSAGSRLLVHRDVQDELLEAVVQRLRATTIGPGAEDPDLGPLVSAKQQQRVEGFMDDLAGGELLTGGSRPESEHLAAGAYFSPTLVHGVDPQGRLAQEEVFGPVIASMSFDDEEEAVALANGTDYGLLAAVWTRDISRGHRLASALRAGQVFVNNYGAGGGVELPFGGWGKSGYGREKGTEALDAFTQTKTVVVKL